MTDEQIKYILNEVSTIEKSIEKNDFWSSTMILNCCKSIKEELGN